MALPWGTTTVLGHVIRVLASAGLSDILVVGGAERELVEGISRAEGARFVLNESFAEGEMLSSIQVGLNSLGAATEAALIALGDQPQIQSETVALVLGQYQRSGARLVVPSHQRRRGHPWLVERTLWGHLLRMSNMETAREFLNGHASEIHYVEIDSPTVIQDVDTLEDYRKSRPWQIEVD